MESVQWRDSLRHLRENEDKIKIDVMETCISGIGSGE